MTPPTSLTRRAALATALAAVVAPVHLPARAGGPAAWPTKQITLVLPLAPGGATDTLARAVAQGVSERLGQPVILEYKPGGGGTIASAAVARAPADGYTLLFANFATHGTAPTLFKSPGYDPIADFRPLSLVATSPHLLVVATDSPIKSVQELVQAGRQPGRQLAFGSAGVGSPLHLAAEHFAAETGSAILHVPFKGSGPALIDLVGGRLDAMFDNLSSSLPLVQSGKLRALAVTSAARSPLAPSTPTVQESGVTRFATYGWWGVMAPVRTPQEPAGRLVTAIQQTLQSPAVREALASQGFDVIGSGPGEFASHIEREIAKWRTVIRSAQVSAE